MAATVATMKFGHPAIVSEHNRYLHYPQGLAYLKEKFDEELEYCANGSFIDLFLKRVDLKSGSTYIEVPFGCAEDIEIPDLWRSPFEVEKLDKDGDLAWFETAIVFLTNTSFRHQVASRESWIVTECEGAPEGWEDKMQRRPPDFAVAGVYYRYVDPSMDEETTWDVLNDPTPRFRFLVKAPPPELTDWSLRLEYFAENVQCVALQIFDYMGYLLWFPKAGSEGDQPLK